MNTPVADEQIELKKNEADRNMLWERYKFWSAEIIQYFRLVLQFSIWFYGITGGIMAFILNKPVPGELKIVFLLPGIMGILSGCAYWYFAWRLRFTNDDLERLAARLFTYTNKEMKVLQTFFNKEEYKTKSPKERFAIAVKEAKDEYGVDGGYSFNTAHHLQTTLAILGLTHVLIGSYSIYLCLGLSISLFAFIGAVFITFAICWRSDYVYRNPR